jgi:hypothetical protein
MLVLLARLPRWRPVAGASTVSPSARRGRPVGVAPNAGYVTERSTDVTSVASGPVKERRTGGRSRRVGIGEPTDLRLLGAPLAVVLAEPTSEQVRAGLRTGALPIVR